VDFIVDFRGLEFPGMECHRVKVVFPVFLRQYCANGEVRCVCFNNDRLLGVEVGQDRGRSKSFF